MSKARISVSVPLAATIALPWLLLTVPALAAPPKKVVQSEVLVSNGYAPFGIQTLAGRVFSTYAKQGAGGPGAARWPGARCRQRLRYRRRPARASVVPPEQSVRAGLKLMRGAIAFGTDGAERVWAERAGTLHETQNAFPKGLRGGSEGDRR